MGKLDSKSVVVAGGATGIGRAASLRLAEEGAKVVLGDINIEGARRTVDDIRSVGGSALPVQFDLASAESCQRLVATAIDEFGVIDGLFNVGADLSPNTLGRDGDILNVPVDVWQRTFDVDLTGYFHMIRAALPHMLEAGAGSIVNMSSGVAVKGLHRFAAYGAAKAGVISLTRHVATAFGKKGIRCNVIAPGVNMTENQVQSLSEEERAAMLPTVNSPRFGQPEDIAPMVALLLSDEGAWINGQAYEVSSMRGI